MASLIFGFIILHTIEMIVFGKERIQEEHFNWFSYLFSTPTMHVWVFMWLTLLIAATVLKQWTFPSFHPFSKNARLIDLLQHSISMCLSWHMLIVGRWIVTEAYIFGIHSKPDPELQWVMNTFMLTLGTAVFIIFLNKLADFRILNEEALRALIHGLALLVGLSWERSFHSADKVIILALSVNSIWQVALAIVLFVFIFPAWKWYIAPIARLPVPEERMKIVHTHQRYQNFVEGCRRVRQSKNFAEMAHQRNNICERRRITSSSSGNSALEFDRNSTDGGMGRASTPRIVISVPGEPNQ